MTTLYEYYDLEDSEFSLLEITEASLKELINFWGFVPHSYEAKEEGLISKLSLTPKDPTLQPQSMIKWGFRYDSPLLIYSQGTLYAHPDWLSSLEEGISSQDFQELLKILQSSFTESPCVVFKTGTFEDNVSWITDAVEGAFTPKFHLKLLMRFRFNRGMDLFARIRYLRR